MEFPVTADQVRQTVIDYGITHLPHHDCSLCGTWVSYVFSETNGEVAAFFDSNCSCSDRWSPRDPRSWQEIADWFNDQSVPGVAQELWNRLMAQATRQPTAKPVPEHISDERLRDLVNWVNNWAPGHNRNDFQSALTELQHRREAEAAYVSVRTMKVSQRPDGSTADFFVSIKVGNREVTPHVFRERFKAEYHVALYDWLLNGGHEPDLMAFREDDWPARKLGPDLAASPSSPASGVRVKALEWVERHDGWQADTVIGIYMVLAVRALPKPFEVLGPRSYIGLSDDEVSGKAAAQAHFDAAILSALGEHP